MARIRTIKPEFWADEKLSPLSPLTRLTFLGLISMADDAGRLLDNTKQIDAFVFPNTNHSTKDALEELARLGRIIRGKTESGQPVIEIAKWQEHQRVTHPSSYTLPSLVKVSGNSQETIVTLPTTNDLLPTTNDPPPPTPEEWFEKIWEARPRRPNDSRADALKAFLASLKRGADPQAVLDGIVRYAAFCANGGVSDKRYIKQTATFLGPGEWWLAEYAVPERPKSPEDLELEAIVAEAGDVGRMIA